MYPIILNNKEDLIKFVQENKDMILDILEDEDEISQLQYQLDEKQQKIDEFIYLQDGISKGVSSYHVGEFNEKILQERLSEELNDWEVDKDKKMKAMDIRLVKENITIGIECKQKKNITKNDLNKFKKDKLSNKFDGNIFISNNKIPNIIGNINNCLVLDKDLYIYSNNIDQIVNFIKVYIQTVVASTQDDQSIINKEVMSEIFVNHSKQKKTLLEQDKVMVKLMRELGVSTKGFLYLGVSSKYKGGKNPY